LIRALTAVQQLETPYRLTPIVAETIGVAARERTDGRGRLLRAVREPLDIEKIQRDLPPGYLSLLRDTIAITRLSAGTSVNVVPSKAVGEVDIRLLPGSETGPMLQRVKEAVGDNGTVEVLLQSEPIANSPWDTELYDTLARRMREAAPGSAVAPFVGAGTTDSRFFRQKGIVAYGVAPFKVNYYDADTVHAADERIRARFFVEGVRLVRGMVGDFAEAK
jgi:acetylornithine deacetylase/succinyl-diaminopimelate desuccinylase-like protein